MNPKKRINPLSVLVGTMWQHAGDNKRLIVIYLLLSAMSLLVWLTVPLVTAELMNAVKDRSGADLLKYALILLGISLFMAVLGWALHGPSRLIETLVSFSIKSNFQTKLIEKVTLLPVAWHQRNHSGEIIDKIAKATTALGGFSEASFEILRLFGMFLVSFAMLVWFMPLVGLVIIVASVVIVFAILHFDRVLVGLYQQSMKSYNEIAASVQDYLTNIVTVISLRLESRVVREVFDRTERIRPIARSICITDETKWFSTTMIVDGIRAITLIGFISLAVWKGNTIQIGTFYILVEYLRTLGEAFYQFTRKYGDLLVKATRVQAVDHINEAFLAEVGETAKAHLPHGWQKLEIKNLTFRHPEQIGEVPVVDNVDLTLERGKSYAFVGESGSGKSTLLALLRGLQRANEASVYCDGKLLEFGLSAVSHHTSLIPQDPEIFADTIRFNITLGIEANDADIQEALKMSRFKNVISRFPKGIESSVAEKGVSLSGGEKQRLALARGLFFAEDHDSEIILLDESTSSVDLVNERLIYEMLLKHFKSRVVISAIHKFNLLTLFDEIVVVEKGKVIERGTLAELLSIRGNFYTMWSKYNGDTEEKVAV